MRDALTTYDPLPRFVLAPAEPARLTADDLAELLRDDEVACERIELLVGGQGRDAADLAGWSAIACGLFLILGVLIGMGVHAAS